ncbi:MAG: prenyltransferase/squalene oxidase repeat-containing protein [Opitutaceae bacterium]|nr:prenyltransferase/squalene oxidase repeat-containing protein [Opitutaceae bacterium]
MPQATSALSRRQAIKLLAITGLAALSPRAVFGQSGRPAVAAITAFLESLRRPDHGYGWPDQEIAHLTPTFGVVGAYHLLQIESPDPEELATYVRTHHPREVKPPQHEARIFDWQQVQALQWLGADATGFVERVAAFTQPIEFKRIYERQGYPVAQSELSAVLAHALLGLPTAGIAGAFGRYLDERCRPNGSFNNTPAADGGDGHVITTLIALQASHALGRALPPADPLIEWLRACQLPNGGFTFQPQPSFGGVDDVAYVSAAVRALQLLGAAPARPEACIGYIHSLANADGGFADRPGWLSNATATFHALDTLAALSALDTLHVVKRRPARSRTALPADLKIFSAQIEAHGTGSPADAVELARGLQIDLWGAKKSSRAWRDRFAAIAAERRVPVTLFTSDEEHGTWVDIPGFGTYSHMSDVIAPASADIGAPVGLDRATARAVSWEEFRTRRLAPLTRADGRLIWQFGENEPLMRMVLDDSVARGGFAAISTYHFGNPDFLNSQPFLNRWRGRLPFVALQDAHGAEPWYFADFTTGFRTLFLATEPTWAGWLNALKQNWTVPVRRDVWTKGVTWMHSGSDEVLEFVRARETEWRWWDNPQRARPLVSIVPVRPHDEFEAGRPESGINLRVRCAWSSNYLGALRTPLAELVKLIVDGREVEPVLIEQKWTTKQPGEHAHHYALSGREAEGEHAVTAVVREIATQKETTHTIRFGGQRS